MDTPIHSSAVHNSWIVPPPATEAERSILTPEALEFLVQLARAFSARRESLLRARAERQRRIDAGEEPDFLEETRQIRHDPAWRVAAMPADLTRRWVEITGPTDRKMLVNALNSGADVYMADFEDAHSPTWAATLQGQANLQDAIRRRIDFVSPEGKSYALKERVATLMMRPRGWHLVERHLLVDGQPIAASLFDFGLYFFHNARALLERGTGPYFYLPKLENRFEARLWNDVFVLAQQICALPRGSIRATVLIENVLATFEAEEILYELREHSAGLNVGRWDYIASFARAFRNRSDFLLPDRGRMPMTCPFLEAYDRFVIQVCHRRGAHAIGGMAAQIPIKGDEEANRIALARVVADKEREVRAGHDGTWVAHPGLVAHARRVFEKHLGDRPHQIDARPEEIAVTADDLLRRPLGSITEDGLRENLRAQLYYLGEWLGGNGAVAIPYHDRTGRLQAYLMEDAATAEIARNLVWKWHKTGARLEDGRRVTGDLLRALVEEEMQRICSQGMRESQRKHYELAQRLCVELVVGDEFPDYFTLPAYELLLHCESEVAHARS